MAGVGVYIIDGLADDAALVGIGEAASAERRERAECGVPASSDENVFSLLDCDCERSI